MTNNTKGLNGLEVLYASCHQAVTEFQKHLVLADEKIEYLQSLITHIETAHFDTTKAKGDALETLTKKMFQALLLFEILPNIHTSSNEIDFLCKLSQPGMVAKANGYITFDDDFLIECKNLNTRVDVTFIGKFAALLQAQNKNFGIMVSSKGITGSGWGAALGLTKKLYLKNDTLIISFTLEDFKSLKERSFFDIIEAKKQEIINDTDYSHFLTKHPAME